MDVCTIVPPLAYESADHLIACWLSEATREAGRPTGTATGGAA